LSDSAPANAYLGGRILIVDDEASNVVLLERMLARAGYSFLTSTTDSREALRLFQETNADLILLDLRWRRCSRRGRMYPSWY
jgi:CheY-like chemotaxis protein